MNSEVLQHIKGLKEWRYKSIDIFFQPRYKRQLCLEGDVLGRVVKLNGKVLDFNKLHKFVGLTPYTSYQWGCEFHISQLELAKALFYTIATSAARQTEELNIFVNLLDQLLLKHLPSNFKATFHMANLLQSALAIDEINDDTLKKVLEDTATVEEVINPYATEMDYEDHASRKGGLGAPIERV